MAEGGPNEGIIGAVPPRRLKSECFRWREGRLVEFSCVVDLVGAGEGHPHFLFLFGPHLSSTQIYSEGIIGATSAHCLESASFLRKGVDQTFAGTSP